MSNVVPIRKCFVPDTSPHGEFVSARSRLLSALMAWLGSLPAEEDAQDEIDATISAIRQIHEIARQTNGR